MSTLEIIIGPMFAGKTTSFINSINKCRQNNNSNILIINHSFDTRYGNDEIATHDGTKIPCYSFTNLSELFEHNIIMQKFETVTDIFIDEAQFFPDLYNIVKTLLLNYKKNILIAGLDGDYKQEAFGTSRMLDLIPYATKITKLLAKCTVCNNDAPFTKRLTNSNDKILVGGADAYQPVCINHL